jgi:hypothetical protein
MSVNAFDGKWLIKRELGEWGISEHFNIALQLRHVLKVTDVLARHLRAYQCHQSQ